MTEGEREALFGRLADEYFDRLERGDNPATEEYAGAHPAVAGMIREGFPLLRVLRHSSPVRDALLPEQLGEFRILRLIGRGGMGVVFEAIQEPLGRHVALKVLSRASSTEPDAVERFRREARTAASLHHTNIVPVFAVGEHEGIPFYAMQFIDGQPLAPSPDASDETATPTNRYRKVAEIGLQVAEALAYAHGQGVLHRDVKPSNLLRDSHGTVWITDFGLAKVGDDPDLTSTGDVVGTLRYLAPERFRGECDERSDIYSLGATLYELLSSQPLFDGAASAALVERVTQGRIASLRHIDRRIPRDLETIIQKSMALSPADRYATAAELADDLRRFTTDRPVRARRHSWPEQLWRLARRRPAIAALAASVAVLMIGIAALGWVSAYRLREAERETKTRLLHSQIDRARVSALTGGPGQRFETLATIGEAARLARELGPSQDVTNELRNLAAAALALPDAQPTRTWPGWAPDTATAAVDVRGELFARSDSAGAITVQRVEDGAELRSIPGVGSNGYYLKFSPDGRYLAAQYSGETDLRLWALAPGGTDYRIPVFGSVDFSPDGTLVAIPQKGRFLPANTLNKVGPHDPPPQEGVVSILDLRTGEERLLPPVTTTLRSTMQCAFRPDGRRVAVLTARSPSRVAVYDLKTAKPVNEFETDDSVRDLSWSPDGYRMTVLGKALSVHQLDWPKQVSELHEAGNPIHAGCFTTDGLFVGCETERFRVWDPPARKVLLTVPGHYGMNVAGSRMLSAQGGSAVTLWEVSRSPICQSLGRTIRLEDNQVKGVDWSADGRLLTCPQLGGFGVYELATGREVAWLPEPAARWGPEADTLISSGLFGSRKWTLKRTADGAMEPVVMLPIGPPHSSSEFSLTSDRQMLVVPTSILPAEAELRRVPGAGYRQLLIADLRANRHRFLPEKFPIVRHCSISPDYRWVAASMWNQGESTMVWDAAAGIVAKQFSPEEVSGSARLAFSPDGTWLVTGAGNEYRFWKVGTWDPGLRVVLPAGANARELTFDHTGRKLAVIWGQTQVRILAAESHEELVTLSMPGQESVSALSFSPDSTKLAVGCANGATYVWDLQRLQAELGQLGVNWSDLRSRE